MNTESPQKSVSFVSSLPRYKNNDTDSPPELATSKGVQKKAVNLQQCALIHSEIKRQVDAAPRAAMTGPQIEDERMILVKVVKGIPEFMETVSRKKGKLVRSARRFDNMLRKFQASYGVRFSVQEKNKLLAMTRTSEVDEGPVTRVFKHIQQLVSGTTFHTLSRVESFMGDFLIDRTLEFYEEKNTEYQQSIKSKLGLANELPVFEK